MNNETNNYQGYENYEWYIKNELNPALAWKESTEGQAFLSEHFPNLLKLDPKQDIFRCYLIRKGLRLLYAGEARRAGRLIVHAWHLSSSDEVARAYFGVSESEVKDITIELDSEVIPDPAARKERELQLRRKLHPILNPAELGDRCIPRAQRYDAVHEFYQDDKALEHSIRFVLFEAPFMYGWTALARKKTPCCNNEEIEIPSDLPYLIDEYFNGLTRTERRKHLKQIAFLLGEGFYVRRSFAITLLSRVLAQNPLEKDSINLISRGCELQIKQRQRLLNEINCLA